MLRATVGKTRPGQSHSSRSGSSGTRRVWKCLVLPGVAETHLIRLGPVLGLGMGFGFGLVGYPNVGKSSTVNVLVAEKKTLATRPR